MPSDMPQLPEETTKPPLRRHIAAEALIAACVVIAAFAFGTWYTMVHSGAPQGRYEFWIRSAVGLAAFGELAVPFERELPGYRQFMDKKQDHLDIAPGLRPKMRPSVPFERTHAYLIYLTAFCWRIFGLNWQALAPLHGLFYAATAIAGYGLCRLAMGRFPALLATVCFMLTPGHLTVLPHLRDYTKAPFILGVIFILGLLLKRHWSWKMLLLWGALIGALIGLGLGFRQDPQICVVPAAAVLLVGLPGPLRQRWPARLGALGAMAAALLLSGWPILQAMREGGGNAAHNIAGGMARLPSDELGAVNQYYEWLALFNDNYIGSVIQEYAWQTLDLQEPVRFLSPEYDAAGKKMILHTMRVFPGDFIFRAMASSKRVLEEAPLSMEEPEFGENRFISTLLPYEAPVLVFFADWGVYVALLALCIVGMYSLRWGIGLLLLALFFTAYPSLQFHFRHYFHLGIFSWWAIFFVLSQGVMGAALLMRKQRRPLVLEALRRHLRPAATRAAILAVLTCVLLTVPLWTARLYQRGTVNRWLEHIEALPRQPLDTQLLETVEEGRRLFLLQPINLFPAAYTPEELKWQQRSAYLVVELASALGSVGLHFLYAQENSRVDYSFTAAVPVGSGEEGAVTRYYAPIFESPKAPEGAPPNPTARQFQGVILPQHLHGLVKGLYRVDAAQVPFAYNVTVPQDWRDSVKTHVEWTPHPLPGPVRRAYASLHNLLPNGGMEIWKTGAAAPEGFEPPYGSSSIDTEPATKGQALRQVWQESDETVRVDSLYGFMLRDLPLGARYDLMVSAHNTSQNTYMVSAWQVIRQPGALPDYTPLHLPLFHVPPSSGLMTYTGTIDTTALAPGAYILITTSSAGNVTPGDTVIWDEWRLTEQKLF